MKKFVIVVRESDKEYYFVSYANNDQTIFLDTDIIDYFKLDRKEYMEQGKCGRDICHVYFDNEEDCRRFIEEYLIKAVMM